MGNEIAATAGAIATVGTAAASAVTFGQCDSINRATSACASYTTKKTQETMVYNAALTTTLVVSGTTVGIVGLITNNDDICEDAKNMLEESSSAAKKLGNGVVDNVSGFLDSTPGIGHLKGVVHDLCDDNEGARRAYFAANRTTGVISGAVVGSIGGPAGAIVGGMAGGATMDGAHTLYASARNDKYSPQGQIAAWTQVCTANNGEERIDGLVHGVLTPVFDGLRGYKEGERVNNAPESQKSQKPIAGGGENEPYVPQKRKMGYDSAKRRLLNDGSKNFADNPNYPNNEYEIENCDSTHTADTISSDAINDTWEYDCNKSVGETYKFKSKVVKLPHECETRGMQLLVEENNRSVTLIQHAGDERYGNFTGSPNQQACDLVRTIGKNINSNTQTLNLLGCHVDKNFAQSVQSCLNANGYSHVTVQVLKDVFNGPMPTAGEYRFSIDVATQTFQITMENTHYRITRPLCELQCFLIRPGELRRQ